MRISDWSSDVCSSDLALKPAAPIHPVTQGEIEPALLFNAGLYDPTTKTVDVQAWLKAEAYAAAHPPDHDHHHRHDVNRHDESIRAFCLTYDKPLDWDRFNAWRSEEHTSELQSLMRNSYAVFCLKKKNTIKDITRNPQTYTH